MGAYIICHHERACRSVMGEQVLGEIISRVKKSNYYSISLDSTPDAAHIVLLALVLRYMEKDGPMECFVIFMANIGHGTQEMFNALMEFLKIHNLGLGNCHGQSYNNASAMSGKCNDLQAKMREKNLYLVFLDSLYNTFSKLGLERCCRMLLECCTFFSFLEKLFGGCKNPVFVWTSGMDGP